MNSLLLLTLSVFGVCVLLAMLLWLCGDDDDE